MVAIETPARSRAAALPAEERRAAILEATVPLLMEHGIEITTRQIAEAAGVAEGTIFRVFTDKDSLIDAAIEQAFDPAPVVDELGAIDPTLDLVARCEAAVTILQARIASLWRLLGALGHQRTADRPPGPPVEITVALAALLEPDRNRLRTDVDEAATALQGLTIAGTHPALRTGDPMTPDQIVSVVLDGIRSHPDGDTSC